MEKGKKGKIVFGIIVGLVVLSGTYALANHFRVKSKGKKKDDQNVDDLPATLHTGGSHVDPVYTVVSPLHTSAEIKAFQTFANTKGMGLVVDGVWGPHTAAAWAEYGGSYYSQGSSGSGTTTPKTKFSVYDHVYANGTAVGFEPDHSTNTRTFTDGSFVGTIQSVDASNPSAVWYLISTATGSKYNVSEKTLRK